MQLLFRMYVPYSTTASDYFHSIVIIAKRVGLKYKLLDITLINYIKKLPSVKEAFFFKITFFIY
jgi:hypothetical protein